MNTGRMSVRIALALTGIWLLVAGSYIYAEWSHVEGLNAIDIGALLSGVVMPLAFLWLIVGYFQQGEELRQNTVALRKQADQLEQQVQGTKSLVLVAVRQTEATVRMVQLERQKFEEETKSKIRAAQPRFVLDQWHAYLGDRTVADAILDRLVHNSYRLMLKGESMRKHRGAALKSAEPSRSKKH